MAQEIEIEYKNLLTEKEYQKLLDHLPFPEASMTQTNYYFETIDFALRKYHCALRIREKNGAYQLTLKEPHPSGLLETHDTLTKEEAESWFNDQSIPKPNTTKQLRKKGISPEDLIYYGELTTKRRETEYKNVLIVLDHSTYNNQKDYEFELEAKSETLGLEMFNRILNDYEIERKLTPNKIQRFFNSFPNGNDE